MTALPAVFRQAFPRLGVISGRVYRRKLESTCRVSRNSGYSRSRPGLAAGVSPISGVCMDLEIAGARVLVTAGANGIGLAIARAFIREGAKVYVCDIDDHALEALRTTDPKIAHSHCDVTDRNAVAGLFVAASMALGGLDVLVNNAGIAGPTSTVEEMNPEDWDRCLDVCL